MLQEFTKWFKTKNSFQQRAILLKLEEVFQISSNFGYIQSLKDKISTLTEQRNQLESEISSDSRYKSAMQEIGELKSYISELEYKLKMQAQTKKAKSMIVNFQMLYDHLPKQDREEMKERIVATSLYKRLSELNGSLRSSNNLLHKQIRELVNELIKIKNK